jgi:hypothetical protein
MDKMHMLIHGQCHCANIRFDLEWNGDPLAIPARACDCTFCVKHGGVWTAHAGSTLIVRVGDGALVSRYEFGTRTAVFHVCARCGVVPLATSKIDGQLHAVVNVNAFEDREALPLVRADASFDGEDVDSRLARRKRNWIGDVRVVEQR